jgi:hypothetical protein
MGVTQSIQKINFEDIQSVSKNPNKYLLINTLSESDQDCLILNTITAHNEEKIINVHLHNNRKIKIIIYGQNTNDEKVQIKYNQFIKLGFHHVYIYLGGLFEWLLLQDIYGCELFPTTKKELDLLKYKPISKLSQLSIEY